MFDVGIVELTLVVVVLGVAVVSGWMLRWVNVNQVHHVAGHGIDLERSLLTSLNALSRGAVAATGAGRITLTLRRTPMWTVVLAVLLFPFGLLFLLFKVEQTLSVLITPDERGGSRVDLIGVTPGRILDAVTHTLVSEHGADAEPRGVRL